MSGLLVLPLLCLGACACARAETAIPAPAGGEGEAEQAFVIQVVPGGWDTAPPEDIQRLLSTVVRDLRANFGDLPKRVLRVEHGDKVPVTLFKSGPNAETVIQLTSDGLHWAQFSYQFAHELCHVLANYQKHDANGPNQWFEETLCETSSLYALRRMAVTWKTAPPYPNWSGYGPSLTAYADAVMQRASRQLPAGTTLAMWFSAHRDQLRRSGVERELNGVAANVLLPLLEQDPRRWDAVRFLNLGDDEHLASFAAYLASWRDRAPSEHRAFIQQVMTRFGFPGDVTIERARTL
jgi:hypothetical protein